MKDIFKYKNFEIKLGHILVIGILLIIASRIYNPGTKAEGGINLKDIAVNAFSSVASSGTTLNVPAFLPRDSCDFEMTGTDYSYKGDPVVSLNGELFRKHKTDFLNGYSGYTYGLLIGDNDVKQFNFRRGDGGCTHAYAVKLGSTTFNNEILPLLRKKATFCENPATRARCENAHVDDDVPGTYKNGRLVPNAVNSPGTGQFMCANLDDGFFDEYYISAFAPSCEFIDDGLIWDSTGEQVVMLTQAGILSDKSMNQYNGPVARMVFGTEGGTLGDSPEKGGNILPSWEDAIDPIYGAGMIDIGNPYLPDEQSNYEKDIGNGPNEQQWYVISSEGYALTSQDPYLADECIYKFYDGKRYNNYWINVDNIQVGEDIRRYIDPTIYDVEAVVQDNIANNNFIDVNSEGIVVSFQRSTDRGFYLGLTVGNNLCNKETGN